MHGRRNPKKGIRAVTLRTSRVPVGRWRRMLTKILAKNFLLYALAVIAFVAVLSVFIAQMVVSNKKEATIQAFEQFDQKNHQAMLINRGDTPTFSRQDKANKPDELLPLDVDNTMSPNDALVIEITDEPEPSESDPEALLNVLPTEPVETAAPSKPPVDNTPHYVQKEVVYVRVGPGQNHDVEGLATFGLKLLVLEKGAEWSKVRTETGITGYMRNDLFDVNVPVRPEPVAPPAPVDLYVKAKVVNLREQPTENSAVVIYLCENDRVSLIAEKGDWVQVSIVSGIEGYIHKDLLKSTPPEDTFESMGRTLYANEDEVLLRNSPSANGPIIGSVKRDESVYEIEANSTWSKVRLSNGKTGFIRSDMLTIVTPPPAGYTRVEKTVYINCASVNIRTMPNTDSLIVAVVYEGASILTKAVGSEWTMVKAPNGEFGYIRNDLIRNTATVPSSPPSSTTPASSAGTTKPATTTKPTSPPAPASSAARGNPANDAVRARIVEIARSCVGVPYRSTVDAVTKNYMDCSGLVYYVYKVAGFNWRSRQSANTIAQTYGTRVAFRAYDYSSLLPGDLLFYSSNGGRTYDHVAIYIGGEQFVHATRPAAKIEGIRNYYRQPSLVKRIYD
ncbi:MAG: SH3 domain-containing protein [Clostridiaceae bacterium]|nr:SH3 domain-containing protein [Clostridiaceae bacterium]